MSTECTKCHDFLTRSESSIACLTCTGVLLFNCAGYNEISFKKMSNNSKMRFVCNECKMIGSGTKTKITNNITDSNVVSGKKFEKLITSVNFMGNQFDELIKKNGFYFEINQRLKT